jgi:hypothetical protein
MRIVNGRAEKEEEGRKKEWNEQLMAKIFLQDFFIS